MRRLRIWLAMLVMPNETCVFKSARMRGHYRYHGDPFSALGVVSRMGVPDA